MFTQLPVHSLFRVGYLLTTDLFSSVAEHVGLRMELYDKVHFHLRPVVHRVYYPLLIGVKTYEDFISNESLGTFEKEMVNRLLDNFSKSELNYLELWFSIFADLDQKRNPYFWFNVFMSEEASKIRRLNEPGIMNFLCYKKIEEAYMKFHDVESKRLIEGEIRQRITRKRLSAWDYLIVGAGSGLIASSMTVNDLACEADLYLMVGLRRSCRFICWLTDELSTSEIHTFDRVLAVHRTGLPWPTLAVMADAASKLTP